MFSPQFGNQTDTRKVYSNWGESGDDISMSTNTDLFKKRVFYSKTEELLHIIMYLNCNNGCTIREIRPLFSGCEAQIPTLIDKLILIRCLSFFKDKKDSRKHLYWVNDKGLGYLERKKITVEY